MRSIQRRLSLGLISVMVIVGVVLVSRRGVYGNLRDTPWRRRAARPLRQPSGEPL